MACELTLRGKFFLLNLDVYKRKGAQWAPLNVVELFCESVHSKSESASL